MSDYWTQTTCENKDCRKSFKARTADIDRGWGRFCSKSCKAKNQTKVTGVSGPHYKASGKTVEQMASGNYANSRFHGGQTLKGKVCQTCGEAAETGHFSPFGVSDGIEWSCHRHADDTHPFDSSNFDD